MKTKTVIIIPYTRKKRRKKNLILYDCVWTKNKWNHHLESIFHKFDSNAFIVVLMKTDWKSTGIHISIVGTTRSSNFFLTILTKYEKPTNGNHFNYSAHTHTSWMFIFFSNFICYQNKRKSNSSAATAEASVPFSLVFDIRSAVSFVAFFRRGNACIRHQIIQHFAHQLVSALLW